MKEKYITLIKEQIAKLDDKDFDLNAWKARTNIILARIFGDNNQKIRQINEIKYEYGSWSLRDISGSETAEDICKKLSKEILDAAVDELENFGVPEKKISEQDKAVTENVVNSFKDHLTGAQVKEMKKILTTSENEEVRKKQILEIFNRQGSDTLAKIIAGIIMDEEIYKNL